MTATLATMSPPRRAGLAPRVSIHALGEMDDQSLSDLAAYGENDRVRVAALLVLIGRQTAADALAATSPERDESR
jgi:hypothetical protein